MSHAKTIFDLVGLCTRVSAHTDHYVCCEYFGSSNDWVVWVHKRGDMPEIIKTITVKIEGESDSYMFNPTDAYQALIEYLP